MSFASRAFELLSEKPGGKLSIMRVIFLLWLVLPLATWTIVSLAAQEVQSFPASIATILGVLAGSKAIQRFAERA